MQSPAHTEVRLPDLRELVVPAVVSNQFRIAEAHRNDSGYTIPVAVVLWARVSEEVDARLSDTAQPEVKLTAADWTSGDIPWIIEAVGEQRFIAPLLQNLMQNNFKGKQVKYRRRGEDGQIELAELS